MNGEVGGKWLATTGAQYWCEYRDGELPVDHDNRHFDPCHRDRFNDEERERKSRKEIGEI